MRRDWAILLGAYLFLVIATTGFLQPFLALYLQAAGLGYSQVGWALGIGYGSLLLVQPIIGRISDLIDQRRPFIFLSALAAGIAYMSFPRANGLAEFAGLLVVGFNGAAYLGAIGGGVGGVLVARLVGPEKGGAAYASLRVWGSIGYIVIALLSGLLVHPSDHSRAGLDPVFQICPLLFFAAALLSVFLPDPRSRQPERVLAERAPLPPNLVRFLVAYFLYNMALYGASNFISLYLKQLNTSPEWIPRIFAVGVVCEVMVMRRSGKWSDIYGRRPLLMLAFLALPIRLILYAPAPNAYWVAAVQSLHGLNFGIMGAVSVAFAMDLATDHSHGHAQARLGAVTGLAMAIGPACFGWISQQMGLREMFCVASGVGALAATLLIVLVEDSHPSPQPLFERAPGWIRPCLRLLDRPLGRKA